MLQELRIKHFGIIDELDLSFSGGFNVLTGETGAGKSIILNAVQLLLGDRITEDVIRSSEEEATVEALFDVSGNKEVRGRLKEKTGRSGETGEEDLLLVRRMISRSGRGKVFVDGNLATLTMLSEIGEGLLSICGQHEHQSLQRVETHIDILDEFGDLLGLREKFQKEFEKLASLSEEVTRIREEKDRRARDRDLMVFQSREIEDSRVQPGEEEALKEDQVILAHSKKLMAFSGFCQESLYSDKGSVIERIQAMIAQGREAAAVDPSLSHLLKSLESALIQLEDVALAFRDYSRRIEFDPSRLEELGNRLEEIGRLKKKYGPTVRDVLLFKEKVDERLKSFVSEEEKLTRLEDLLGPLRKEVEGLAQDLSSERKRVAAELKRSVERELTSLGMKRTCFEVRIEGLPLSLKGIDRAEFLISPNVGEEVKPLARIASGGELSRIMLAMKRILAKVGGREVLVFDEVDSGIGGAIAEVVGRKLRDLAKRHQVICVTHLPQIACFADRHHSVKKEVRAGRTVTTVEWLQGEGVAEEIARMLGGVKVTEKARVHAREMIENARKS